MGTGHLVLNNLLSHSGLLTGEVVLPTAILFLVFVLWFSVYKLLFKGLETRELVKKMYADLEGALARERIAQEEAQRRVVEERKEQALWERERRRHSRDSRPARDPDMDKYAGIIETRVREGERTR